VYLQAHQENAIDKEDWEKRLAMVRVRKEDMDKLVMNFLVIEVRRNVVCR
jgi:hypothetical protein